MRKPEGLAPGEGPRVELDIGQLNVIQAWASERGAAAISIEDRGEGYLRVAAFDKENLDVGRRSVLPLEGRE